MLLALGDRRQRHGAVGAMLGEIGHRHDRVPAFGVQLHAAILHACRHPAQADAALPQRLAFGTLARAMRRATASSSAERHGQLFRTVLNLSLIYGNSERASQVYSARLDATACMQPALPRARRTPADPPAPYESVEQRMPELIINGPAGRLEARYHHEGAADSPIALILHPHPQFGGHDEQSGRLSPLLHVRRARLLGAALQLPRRRPQPGLSSTTARASWRTRPPRSTGCSSSEPGRALCWIAGVSFGTWIAMQLLMRRPEIDGFICVAPPANLYDFSFLAPCPSSGLMINGDKDRVVPSALGRRAGGQDQDAEGHQDRRTRSCPAPTTSSRTRPKS